MLTALLVISSIVVAIIGGCAIGYIHHLDEEEE